MQEGNSLGSKRIDCTFTQIFILLMQAHAHSQPNSVLFCSFAEFAPHFRFSFFHCFHFSQTFFVVVHCIYYLHALVIEGCKWQRPRLLVQPDTVASVDIDLARCGLAPGKVESPRTFDRRLSAPVGGGSIGAFAKCSFSVFAVMPTCTMKLFMQRKKKQPSKCHFQSYPRMLSMLAEQVFGTQ